MAFVLADKVREACNAPGTSDFELWGAPPSADTLTFASQIGGGNTTRYQAWGAEGWEIGIGEVSTVGTNRLLRPDTVLINSSGGTSLIDFQGTVHVACVFSTSDLPYHDENGDVPARGGRDLGTDADRWRNLWLSGEAAAGGGVLVPGLRLGLDNREILSDVDNSFVRVGGNSAPNVGVSAILHGTGEGDVGELRYGSSALLRWGDGVIKADNGAGGLLTIATVSQSSDNGQTTFPIGHPVLVGNGGALLARRGTAVPCVANNNTSTYVLDSEDNAGDPLTGTYRSCGSLYDGGTLDISFLHRVS